MAQLLHDEMPVAVPYLPATHAAHTLAALAPVAVAYAPVLQLAQFAAPSEGL